MHRVPGGGDPAASAAKYQVLVAAALDRIASGSGDGSRGAAAALPSLDLVLLGRYYTRAYHPGGFSYPPPSTNPQLPG